MSVQARPPARRPLTAADVMTAADLAVVLGAAAAVLAGAGGHRLITGQGSR
jgi:hypothetical protein